MYYLVTKESHYLRVIKVSYVTNWVSYETLLHSDFLTGKPKVRDSELFGSKKFLGYIPPPTLNMFMFGAKLQEQNMIYNAPQNH